MALYDGKWDWYDLFSPGSHIGNMLGIGTDVPADARGLSNIGKTANDLSGVTASQNFNAAEAEKSRQHQVFLAQNQYQWAVDDMKKAGLNPAMMYASGGNGNTAPSGASASSSSGSIGEVLGAVGSILNGINSARSLDLRTKTQQDDKVTSYMYDNLGRIMEKVTFQNRR